MKYGLLGRKLSHSLSPQIHRMLGDYRYELLEREPDQIGTLFTMPGLSGFNVTIPYKKDVMPFCDQLTDAAVRIGCVNTVVKGDDGTFTGDNTDYDGFRMTVESLVKDLSGKRVVIVGKGATSQTVETVCTDLGAASVRKLGREDMEAPDQEARRAEVLINCTPVGMYPNTGEAPVRLADFPELGAVIDVVYNPHRTALLLDAKARGIPYTDGLTMLVGQAFRAAELFTGTALPLVKLDEIRTQIRKDTENLVLIGMPGSGKSTLGDALADRLQKRFIDLDVAIEEEIGMPIPDYFARFGEDAFRDVEAEQAKRYGKESGLVIATGGGIIKREENYNALAQNGTICYLQRELEHLPTKGRPLSAGGLETLKRLYAEREPLYRKFCDYSVENRDFNTTIEKIMEGFYEHCRH